MHPIPSRVKALSKWHQYPDNDLGTNRRLHRSANAVFAPGSLPDSRLSTETSRSYRVSLFLAGDGLNGGVVEMRQRDAVIALNVERFAAVGYRANQNRLPWTIVIARIAFGCLLPCVPFQWDQIEDSRGEMAYDPAFLMSDIPGHAQRLEVDFRPHNCGAEIEHYTALQPRYVLGKGKEITVARFTEGGSIAVGMFVQNVVADADMDRHR